jgi:hypothetical protein
MTVFAKISPNPSITPFTNGKKKLMDNDEHSAQKRVLAGSVSSNTARVIDAAAPDWVAAVDVVVVVVVVAVARAAVVGCCCCCCCSGECGREGSGNDMDGNDEVGDDGKFSHCGESVGSPVLVLVPVVAERRAGALELVGRGWSIQWGFFTPRKLREGEEEEKRN